MKTLNFFQLFIFIVLAFSTLSCSIRRSQAGSSDAGYSNSDNPYLEAERAGWPLAVQTYTFRLFTFEEALDKIVEGGFRYVEAYRRQPISSAIQQETHFNMDEDTREIVREMLESRGLRMINYGVVRGETEEEWEQIFQFAKAMGVETINSEPAPQFLDLVDRLANEYEINVAIHNHPAPSRYYSPEAVLEALEGRSKRMGVCADIGHWIRSGLDPIECLKKLEGRILTFHFKDLNEKSREAHDVIWGQGVAQVEDIMREMKRQGFSGVVTIEYEHNWENNLPYIIESARFFNKVAASFN